MANSEHLAILNQGVNAWNEWRQKARGRIDLQNAELSGKDLTGIDFGVKRKVVSVADPRTPIEQRLAFVDLRGADLSAATLTGARLAEANLAGASLANAVLIEAVLTRANLEKADLSGAYFVFANLESANLAGVKMHTATLRGAVFLNTYFGDATGLETCIHEGPSAIDIWTLRSRPDLPPEFLRGCGLPDALIDYLPSLVNQAVQFYSGFISYSHTDKAFARCLHDTLQARGIRCWLDEKQLLPGDDIYEHVDRGIRLWDKTLLCCSEASLTSWWVDNEIGTALEKEQQLTKKRGEKVQVIIPLNLDGYILRGRWKSGYRAQIRRRLAADFTGWETDVGKFEREVENVIRALRADGMARERPPEPQF